MYITTNIHVDVFVIVEMHCHGCNQGVCYYRPTVRLHAFHIAMPRVDFQVAPSIMYIMSPIFHNITLISQVFGVLPAHCDLIRMRYCYDTCSTDELCSIVKLK